MDHDAKPISRREALRRGAGVGAGLPVVGVGTARYYGSARTEAELAPLREVLRALPRLGGKLVDTAPFYGSAEPVIGRLVEEIGNRDQLFIATKVARAYRGVDESLAEMRRSFERLRTDRIDLMQLHNLGGMDTLIPILREWKDAGRIRYYGVTTTYDRQYQDLERLLLRQPLDFVQVDYAIDSREMEERILPLAADRGVAVLTALPFGRGRVFDVLGQRPIPPWAAELGIRTWAQFALKYVISHPAVTAAIPGTARPAYLADNLGAGRGPFPDRAMRRRMAALVDAA